MITRLAFMFLTIPVLGQNLMSGPMPIVNAGQGPCTVTFHVDSTAMPLEKALISIDMKHPSPGSVRMRLFTHTRKNGSARFSGLPEHRRLQFELSANSARKTIEIDTGTECTASLNVRLE
jgi:hypothetical protein